jgi:hypothetical protein
MTALAHSFPDALAAAAPARPPLIVRAAPAARIGSALASLALAGLSVLLALEVWGDPWTGAGLRAVVTAGAAVSLVFVAQAWVHCRTGLRADGDGLRVALPRSFLALPWPPLRPVALRWSEVRRVRLARRSTRVFLPAGACAVDVPWDVLLIEGDGCRVVLGSHQFGRRVPWLAEEIAARSGRALERV